VELHLDRKHVFLKQIKNGNAVPELYNICQYLLNWVYW